MPGPGTPCEFCGEPIPQRSKSGRRTRADARTCNVVHRQALHRFSGGDQGPRAPRAPAKPRNVDGPRRFAYADPPYPGLARRYYRDHPDYAGEVDHEQLIADLIAGYPDGWALSTHARALYDLLPLCPPQTRVCAYVKGTEPVQCAQATNRWEPVLVCGGRPRDPDTPGVRDWVQATAPRAYPGRVIGTKPARFSFWLFDILGVRQGDTLDDLFPGSGAVAHAFALYTSQPRASREAPDLDRAAGCGRVAPVAIDQLTVDDMLAEVA